MLECRAIAGRSAICLLMTLIAWGCSSSDNGDQPAASLVASDFQLEAPFTEIRPKVRIPIQYTCHGENLSPPLTWTGAPEGTRSYALVGEDPDNSAGLWVHWVLYNIPAGLTQLAEGIPTTTDVLPDGTTQGTNDQKQNGYYGPCPIQWVIPGQSEQWTELRVDVEPAHKYRFTLFALEAELGLAAGATKTELEKAMKDHILAQAETSGKFQLPVVSAYKQEQNRPIYGSFGELSPTTTPSQP